MLKKLICLVLLFNYLNGEDIVCYTTNWSQYRPGLGKFVPENLDPFLCTHLIYSFAKLQNNKLAPYEWNDDSTDWSKGMYERTTDLKKTNPNLKILLAVGGWNMGSDPFIKIVTDDRIMNEFVDDSVTFLKSRKFDGLDLDWEYPAGYKNEFTKLVQRLRAKYTPQNLLLTAAVAAGKSNIDPSYDISRLAENLDFLNIMTYDYHGQWESFTGHNAPLYPRPSENGDQKLLNVDFTVNYYIQQGYPANKINLGLGTYGRSFTLFLSNSNNMGAITSGGGSAGQYTREAGFLAYYEICQFLSSGWTRRWSSEHQVPYAFNGNQWVGYDDMESLKIKVDYAKSKGLGGVMFWATDLDDFDGKFCNQGKYPLINGVKEYLNVNTNPSTLSSTQQQTGSGTSTTVTMVTTTPGVFTNPNTSQMCYNGEGYYPDYSTNCQKYYVCQLNGNNFNLYSFVCPPGLLFDKNLKIYEFSNIVGTDMSSISQTTVREHAKEVITIKLTKKSNCCKKGEDMAAQEFCEIKHVPLEVRVEPRQSMRNERGMAIEEWVCQNGSQECGA
ncbi:unnamed protein product [Brachionus calyciflorus]|uniref:Chitinase n=1 Tax=Brachionus calyciflorus TaxID=104777 RepID=A0A814I0I7_9BILA|nr:unnamed protein product [Brachionus calyciflorus]